MEIRYGPRGIHAELEFRLQRLLAEHRHTRRNRRAHRSTAR
jgi:hypothetical protein